MAAALQAHNRPDPGSGRPCLPNRPLDQPNHPRFEPVDREKTCSLLLRSGGHHIAEHFAVRGKEPKDEVQIYTWKDATLRELTDLEVAPEARRRNAELSVAFVYPDKHGRFVLKQVGMTHSYGNGRRLDDSKALAELNFESGDYLDVAIL
ncbi:Histone deacetylase complex subunit SAP18 [Citrus sinensis]|uniref:Histone deacetylase complex subunit SAP18 n=1 Tax=Citrus sinensis TaxID=2711 RepID=A0ACB8LVV4_CITSI|nr:Histone deacetylase complex subunit SAP18 [Citrus sinensis]